MAICRLGKKITFLFIFSVILVACGGTQSTPTVSSEIVEIPTHTPQPAATAKMATAVPTQTATSSPTPSPTATSSPTTTPDPTCPEPGSAAPFTYPADTTELQASILAYINAGGQWEDLMALLDELEIEHDWIQADMNGDEVMETAVFADITIDEYTNIQVWLLLQCQSREFTIPKYSESNYGFHDYFETDDLDQDGNLEIIDVGGHAGSACSSSVSILSWKNREFINYSPDYSVGCSNEEDRILFQDINNDGKKELILSSWTIVHADHAPPRDLKYIFELVDDQYTLLETQYALAEYRFQLLDDAQRALDAGDLSKAITFYNQAAHEDMATLKSYFFPSPEIAKERGEEPDYPDAYQKSFALFRQAVIQLALENNDDANNTLTELIATYPEDQPGHEFVPLTQIFFDTFTDEKDLAKACAKVTEFVSENYTDRPKLTSHFYWGSNVAFYHTPDSLCPSFTLPTENDP